ncbi:DNA excision repair protein ERCC-6-like [Uloborus diversus]|uniref:DNA excision repair protein ERCC-6-like n=1 Tax=Uloborus diversus TaxID=327109 RepID=UPI00240A67D3|nr:DNA excision repair protein ERCC-6-like [Uloborus diversus]
MPLTIAENLSPTQIDEFHFLQNEGKKLAAEGRLLESLQKFELAKQICETPKILKRIEKLKACLQDLLSKSKLSSTTSPTENHTSSLKNQSNKADSVSDVKKRDSSGTFKTPKPYTDDKHILHDVQNVENFSERKKTNSTDKSEMNAVDLAKFNQLKKTAMELSFNGKFEESLKVFNQALALNSCPKVKKYIAHIESMLSSHSKQLKEFETSVELGEQLALQGKPKESLQKLKSAFAVCPSPRISKMIKALEDLSVRKVSDPSSLSPEEVEEFKTLYREAKVRAAEGQLEDALKCLNKAKNICETEKVLKRIKELEHMQSTKTDDGEDDEKMMEVAKGFKVHHSIYKKLYPYQRDGVAWMWQLYNRHKGGVLGDDMGLGKTFQVIAFLSGMIDADLIKNVLIIMPVGLLTNWENEFKKWCPGIMVHCFHGSSKKEKERNLSKVQRRGHVLLTSYGMVVSNIPLLTELDGSRFVWDYVILDEGHKIKNPTKTTKAVHDLPSRNRLVLTGTPIQNNLRELWALYDFAHQSTLLGSLKTFKMQYENIITRSREKDASAGEKRMGTEMAENLKQLIKPYFLRRTKAEVWGASDSNPVNELNEQLENLKLDVRKNDFIVWLYMSDPQIEIYQSFLHSDAVKSILVSKRSPLVELTTLKKICDHPRLLSQRACHQLGLNGSFRAEDLIDDDESASCSSIENVSDETLMLESGKLKFLINLLQNLRENGHRMLVFSLSRKILDMIHRILTNRKWKVMRIDGTISKMEERERRIQIFQTDASYPVFLLTTQVGGVGLTLTAADRVIIYDPSWNPATDAQAVDRIYRIGQKKNVVVYRLITCGSVEEKIYRRQIFKDSITRQTTCSAPDPYRYFSKQELRELFSLENPKYSATQVQLEQMHSAERVVSESLDAHIAFLYSLDIFGISDHDLMFSKNIKDHAEDNDEGAISHDYIKKQVAIAQQLIQAEASVVEQGLKLAGSFVKPFSEPVRTFKKPSVKDFYKAPEIIDITDEDQDDNYKFSKSAAITENFSESIQSYSPDKKHKNSINSQVSSTPKKNKITNYYSFSETKHETSNKKSTRKFLYSPNRSYVISEADQSLNFQKKSLFGTESTDAADIQPDKNSLQPETEESLSVVPEDSECAIATNTVNKHDIVQEIDSKASEIPIYDLTIDEDLAMKSPSSKVMDNLDSNLKLNCNYASNPDKSQSSAKDKDFVEGSVENYIHEDFVEGSVKDNCHEELVDGSVKDNCHEDFVEGSVEDNCHEDFVEGSVEDDFHDRNSHENHADPTSSPIQAKCTEDSSVSQKIDFHSQLSKMLDTDFDDLDFENEGARTPYFSF